MHNWLNRFVTCDPAVLDGRPVIRGTHIAVHEIDALSRPALRERFPKITEEQIEAAIAWAAWERGELPDQPRLRRKAVAYITHRDRLLVFTQPDFPEAGVQVPAGTLETGEPLISGVMREALEETGLTDLALVRFLGQQPIVRSDRNELHHRYVFHLNCPGEPPETWDHFEHFASDIPTDPIHFSFNWWPLSEGLPNLSGDLGALLPELIESR